MSGIGSGTQSPPLEATGEHKPMGVSAVGGGPVEGVLDAEQRKEYFRAGEAASERDGSEATASSKGKEKGPRVMGESMADKLEKTT
ncbi:hypothetical protein BDZ89DRAFT_1066504 [Hymenopellis radicata]|nr:hypothetical protein BDZ89DRAFT_1066504 [Hymenopellis radicata]